MQTASAGSGAIRSSDGETLDLTSPPRIDFIAGSAAAPAQARLDVLQ